MNTLQEIRQRTPAQFSLSLTAKAVTPVTDYRDKTCSRLTNPLRIPETSRSDTCQLPAGAEAKCPNPTLRPRDVHDDYNYSNTSNMSKILRCL